MTTDAKCDALEAWVRAGGGEISGVTMQTMHSGERGLFATRNLSPDEVIVRLPMSMLLTGERSRSMPHVSAVLAAAERDALSEILGEFASSDSDTIAMVLFLIAARVHSGDTIAGEIDYADGMGPWIDALPDAFYTPVTVSECFIEENLDRSMVLAMAGAVREELRALFDKFIVPYAIDLFPEAYPTDKVTYECFLWAHCATSSRAFGLGRKGPDGSDGGGEQTSDVDDGFATDILTPFADMMNHVCDDALLTVIAGKWMTHPESPGQAPKPIGFQMRIYDRAVAEGEQVYISYGNLENAELLLHYGFADENNPRDRIKMTLTEPIDSNALLVKKSILLEMANCGNLGFYHALSPYDALPENLVASVRVLCMTEREAEGVTIRTDFRHPLCSSNELVTIQTLSDMVRSMQTNVSEPPSVGCGDKVDEPGLANFQRFCNAYMSSSQALLAAALKRLVQLERRIPALSGIPSMNAMSVATDVSHI
jgi:SET domain